MLWSLHLTACIENAIDALDVSGPIARDSRPESECDDANWSDGTVDPGQSCIMPRVDWNLQVKWTWNGAHSDGHERAAHTGRFEDGDGDGAITVSDPVGVWLTAGEPGASGHFLVDGSGTTVYSEAAWDGDQAYATIGDVDPGYVGMEYVLNVYSANDPVENFAAAVGGQRILYDSSTGRRFGGVPTLVDLDSDGAVEVLGMEVVTSADDGQALFNVEGQNARNVAGDLDLDGFSEILTALDGKPHVLDHSGVLRAVCPVTMGEGSAFFALGNLDGDPEGEFVVGTQGVLAVCEVDGTLDATLSSGSLMLSMIGLAELDGDSTPEIVVDYSMDNAIGIVAYNADLSVLWSHTIATHAGRAPFALADLDGDTCHEVIVHDADGRLIILGPDATELASIEAPITGTPLDAPIIADIDGDGLAEILVSGADPNLAVYTNDAGGWAVQGGQDPWPGVDHFPGDRNLDGTLPAPDVVPWLVANHNVWQGLAAGPEPLPDIGVEIADACADDCRDILFTVYVSNLGTAATIAPFTLQLFGVDDGALLASQTVDSAMPSGLRSAVQFRIPTAAAGSGVRAVAVDVGAECADVPNEAIRTDLPCR